MVVLNTHGGYLAPMDKIVEMPINAKTPVYAYVPRRQGGLGRIHMAPTAAEPRPPDPKDAAARMRSLAEAKWNDSRVDIAAALYMAATGQPYYQTQAATYAIAGILATAAVALAYIGYKVRQALQRRPQDYATQLIGAVGIAKTPIAPGKPGVVYAAGEEWTAEADERYPKAPK